MIQVRKILFSTCERAIKSMNVYAAMLCRDWFRMPQLAVTSHSTDSTLSNAIEELKGLLLRRFFYPAFLRVRMATP